MKRCTKCGETKAVTEFHRRSDMKDGLYSLCKKCRNTASAKHYAKYPEKARARRIKFQAEYPEERGERRARTAKWRAKNHEKTRQYTATRRAHKVSADGNATGDQIQARWEVYGGICYICGCPAEATDHVKPLAAGGSNWPANLRPICGRCNSVKGATWPFDFVAAQQRVYQETLRG